MRTPEEVALTHAIIGVQHVKQGAAQTVPEDVALCSSCGWMRLSDYTLHIADLIRARDAEVAEQVRAKAWDEGYRLGYRGRNGERDFDLGGNPYRINPIEGGGHE